MGGAYPRSRPVNIGVRGPPPAAKDPPFPVRPPRGGQAPKGIRDVAATDGEETG